MPPDPDVTAPGGPAGTASPGAPPPPPPMRALPAWALALGCLLAAAVPLVLAARGELPPADAWTEAATATGIVGAVMLMLQMVSSGRFRVLSGRIGIDVTMGFHRWAATLALVLSLAHVLALAGPLDPADPMRALRRLWAMLSAPGLRDGVIALALAAALAVAARFRDRLGIGYELWRASHAALALAFVWFLLRHILDRGTHAAGTPSRLFWIALALAVVAPFVLQRLRALAGLIRYRWRIVEVRPRGTGLWEVVLASATGRALPFRAGQFVWLQSLPRRLPILFDHPFSISSAPDGRPRLSLLIGEAGDFTRRIGQIEIGRPVGLDGPHGNFTVEALGPRAEALVLVAGGLGVAPILSILLDLAQRGERRPVRVILAARSPEVMVDPALIDPPAAALGARVIRLADDPGDPPRPGLLRGPLRAEHLRAALEGLDPARTGALICGPPALITAASDGLATLGLPMPLIHYERFDYAAAFASRKDRQVLNRFRLLGLAMVLAALAFTLR